MDDDERTPEHLLFKWGSLKGWCVRESGPAWEPLKRWFEAGVSMSAAAQHDTADQKQALCDLIDAIDGKISNDWTGENMTKDEAKKYVMEYGA